MTGIRPYDRRAGFLYTDDIVKVVDYDGNEALFVIQRHESIAQHSVRFTSRVLNGGIPAGQSVFADFRFTQPARENRLFELRPFIFAVREVFNAGPPPAVVDGRLILAPTPLNAVPVAPDTSRIPAGVELRWRHPSGTFRTGTDLQFNVVVNITPPSTPIPAVITTPGVGGVSGGFIEAILTPYTDDISDLWKLNAIYGHTIEFGIANRSDLFWAPGAVIGGNDDDKQYFIGVIGRKHILGPCPEWLAKKVDEEDIAYKTVTIGGIPITTTRA